MGQLTKWDPIWEIKLDANVVGEFERLLFEQKTSCMKFGLGVIISMTRVVDIPPCLVDSQR